AVGWGSFVWVWVWAFAAGAAGTSWLIVTELSGGGVIVALRGVSLWHLGSFSLSVVLAPWLGVTVALRLKVYAVEVLDPFARCRRDLVMSFLSSNALKARITVRLDAPVI